MMFRTATFCLLIISIFAAWVFAEVDQRPLPVKIVPAFPQLDWPDWLRGLDVGRPRDPRPLLIMGARDGTNRILAGTEYGTVHVWANDPQANKMETFIDLRDRVQYIDSQNEEGFLGLAFHPRFKENGEFFVYYSTKPTTEKPHLTVVSRFHASKDHTHGDPASEEIILTIEHPYWNHKGGTIVFGPDGCLYIGLGDGGAFNDPHGNGQKLTTLLGKILRIDIDHKDPGMKYAIPKDNPFANRGPEARGEIWAYGIRNVWRIAFDRTTGDLWAGDVGQDTWEEIDIIRRGGNYGWSLREGMHPLTVKDQPQRKGSPPRSDLIEPIWEYNHNIGKSITGGNVYRGKQVPELVGAYLYGDYVTGQIWALYYDRNKKQVTANRSIQPKGLPLLSFGEDDNGESYFLTQQGGIMKFAPQKYE
jgi:glucose/arabinose dehydrogenase